MNRVAALAPPAAAARASGRPALVAMAVALAMHAGSAAAQVEPDTSEPGEEPAERGAARALAPPFAAATAPRVAVLLLPAGPDIDPAMADALTELLIAAVAARGERVQIVGKEELQAQLGRDDAGTARCLESAACLGRVGVELDVREIVWGRIARRSDDTTPEAAIWTFDLHRLDVRSDAPLGRVFREVRGDLDALLHALEEAIPELYVRPVQPGRLVLRASVGGADFELDGMPIGRFEGEPVRRETVEPGGHVLRVRAEGYRVFEREIEVEEGATLMIDAVLERGGGWRPSPLVWVGGAVALGASVAAIALGVASQAGPAASLSMRETIDDFYPAREREATAANAMWVVAAAGAAAMIAGLVISGDDAEPRGGAPRAQAWIAPEPSGAAGGIAGRF